MRSRSKSLGVRAESCLKVSSVFNSDELQIQAFSEQFLLRPFLPGVLLPKAPGGPVTQEAFASERLRSPPPVIVRCHLHQLVQTSCGSIRFNAEINRPRAAELVKPPQQFFQTQPDTLVCKDRSAPIPVPLRSWKCCISHSKMSLTEMAPPIFSRQTKRMPHKQAWRRCWSKHAHRFRFRVDHPESQTAGIRTTNRLLLLQLRIRIRGGPHFNHHFWNALRRP